MNSLLRMHFLSRHFILGLLASGVLLACSHGALRQTPPVPQASPATAGDAAAASGAPYQVVAAESLLTIRVYRAGTLARMGHNHVIASHDLSGTVHIPEDLTAGSFELRFPVAKLTIDEPQLRQAEQSEEFPPEVPQSARDGTRHNMLGESQLDGDRFPEIVIRSQRIEVTAPDELIAYVLVTVRDHTSAVTVPMHHEIKDGALLVSGEFPLAQSALGLAPLSVMMGALQTKDEMKIRFSVRAVPAAL